MKLTTKTAGFVKRDYEPGRDEYENSKKQKKLVGDPTGQLTARAAA